LLDGWYAAGYRYVDTATNYPLNGNPADWRRSEQILADWLRANGISDLAAVVKVGSLSNERTPDNNLNPSFLRLNAAEYAGLLGSNLACLMLHWDNRSDREAIATTLAALRAIGSEYGLRAGLSGIKHPEVYREVLAAYPDWRLPLEAKHNVFQSGLAHYAPLRAQTELWVYGINGGGVKLDDRYRNDASLRVRGGQAPAGALRERLREWLARGADATGWPRSMNELGLLYAYYDDRGAGILLGPSRPEQLQASFAALARMREHGGAAAYRSLTELLADAPE
jgi:aryl-alcohol dehydrogenase-like predicted oxidoreductase